MSVAFRVQTACTRFFLSFFPAPLYTRLCIMRGPVYTNAFFFFSSHSGDGDDRKRKCTVKADGGNIALPAEQLHNSNEPQTGFTRLSCSRSSVAVGGPVKSASIRVHQFLPFTGRSQTDRRGASGGDWRDMQRIGMGEKKKNSK